MAPDTEIPVAAKDRLPSGVAQRARAPWLRFGRLPLVLITCALLAAGGYYALLSASGNADHILVPALRYMFGIERILGCARGIIASHTTPAW